MARKKPPEEHENLERWLVSYSDLLTLMFATFVTLYALAMVDAEDFNKLEESIKAAFTQNSLLDGKDNILENSDSIFEENNMANSFIPSLMLEYINPKYEESSFNEIEKTIQDLTESGELEGIKADKTELGLLITFNEKYLFAPASAQLDKKAKKLLDKVGVIICKKFILHSMIVEGHTDSSPISNKIYPSNWELSAVRATTVVRYLIDRFKFNPKLLSATAYADTKPVAASNSVDASNRRVEILILKNKYKNQYDKRNINTLSLTKEEQEKIQKQREEIIRTISCDEFSLAAKKLMEENEKRKKISSQKSDKLSKKNMELYIRLDNELQKNNDMPKVIKLNSTIPEDDDFGL